MFYNARMYDPVLAHFVSADTVAPSKGDPKSRNRYSYVLNNPLRYTDPSGYTPTPCPDGLCTEEERTAADEQAKYGYAEVLRLFGFTLDADDWTLEQLAWMVQGINDLLKYAGKQAFSYEAFRNIMGIRPRESVTLYNADQPDAPYFVRTPSCRLMCTDPNGGKYIAISPKGMRQAYADAKGAPKSSPDFLNTLLSTSWGTSWIIDIVTTIAAT
jgi:hypothetical protein